MFEDPYISCDTFAGTPAISCVTYRAPRHDNSHDNTDYQLLQAVSHMSGVWFLIVNLFSAHIKLCACFVCVFDIRTS